MQARAMCLCTKNMHFVNTLKISVQTVHEPHNTNQPYYNPQNLI